MRLHPLACALLLPALGLAQSRVTYLQGTEPGAGFGRSLAAVGDLDGDGATDWAIGMPDYLSSSGRVQVLSGTDGPVLLEWTGAAAADFLGASLAAAGDLNGDGVPDVLVGASQAGADVRGAAFVYSGADGGELLRLDGATPEDRFGWSVAGLGDLNGDGVPELLVGAPENPTDGYGAGAATVFSGIDGSVLYSYTAGETLALFGWAVCALDDLDGDGVDEFAVGAWASDANGTSSGRVTVYSGVDGSDLYVLDGGGNGHFFGWSLANAGDLDADGVSDLIVGAPGSRGGGNGNNSGSAFVYSGANGTLLRKVHGDPWDHLGYAVGAAGDVNGDGRDDFVVGTWQGGPDPTTEARGFARLHSGTTGRVLYTLLGTQAFSQQGTVVASAGDLDGDGRAEVAVTAPRADGAQAQVGELATYRTLPKIGNNVCGPAVPNSTGSPAEIHARGLEDVTANELFLTADRLPSGQTAYFLVSRTPGVFNPPGSDGVLCLAGDIGRFRRPGEVGRGSTLTLQVDLTDLPTNAPGSEQALAGETLYFQCWYRDVGGTNNFTDAVAMLLK